MAISPQYATTGATTAGRWLSPSRALWVLLVVAVIALWPTFASLAGTWLSMADYHHGPLIAVISAVWLHQARGTIDAAKVRTSPLAMLPLLAAVLLWAV